MSAPMSAKRLGARLRVGQDIGAPLVTADAGRRPNLSLDERLVGQGLVGARNPTDPVGTTPGARRRRRPASGLSR